MNTHTNKAHENKSQSIARDFSQNQNGNKAAYQFVDNRPEAIIQKRLQEMASDSPQTRQVARLQAMTNKSTPLTQNKADLEGEQDIRGNFETVQRQEEEELMQGKFNTVQRQEEEELLQGKFDTAQRQEEEELMQGKFDTVQRQEEEELMQGKFDTVQRQEEEELMQGKFDTVQRQEEEELLQGKFETVQLQEEEELLQGKFETVQQQVPEEEELVQGKYNTAQRQEEEELQMKSETAQRQASEEEELLQGKFDTARPDNKTGMPDNLKSGIESLSAMNMSDVRVHYNSSKPAQLNALAYAKGNDIHLGSGQEKHLPHEAWHTVQQKQGRVKPTMQLAGEKINNDVRLEKEADVMGGRASQLYEQTGIPKGGYSRKAAEPPVQRISDGMDGGSHDGRVRNNGAIANGQNGKGIDIQTRMAPSPPVNQFTTETPIQMQDIRMVLKPTYLRQPTEDKSAARIRRRYRIGSLLRKTTQVEMSEPAHTSTDSEWQMAKALGGDTPDQEGFVRLNKITPKPAITTAPPGAGTPTLSENIAATLANVEIEPESLADRLEIANEYVEATEEILGSPTELTQDDLNHALTEDDAESYFVNKLQTKAQERVLLGFGLAQESIGVVSGILGMAQGISQMADPDAEFDEMLDGFSGLAGGALTAAAGGIGVAGKSAEMVTSFTGERSITGAVAGGIANALGPIADAVRTIKSLGETVFSVIKGIWTLVDRAKKGIRTTGAEIGEFTVDLVKSIGETISGAFKTASSILKALKNLGPVRLILGIVGSVIDVVGGFLDMLKHTFEIVGFIKKMRKNKDNILKIEDGDYHQTEFFMQKRYETLGNAAKVKLGGRNKPDKGQVARVVNAYDDEIQKPEDQRAVEKTSEGDKASGEVHEYLVDRHLVHILWERFKTGLTRIPEFILDVIANITNFIGGLISLAADIVSFSGIGTPIAAATKAIASITTGILSGGLKLGRGIYGLVRKGVQKKQRSTPESRQLRKDNTIKLMGMVASLNQYDPRERLEYSEAELAENPYNRTVRDACERVRLRLEVTGVDFNELFSKNEEPLEQAKLIYKAMEKRE